LLSLYDLWQDEHSVKEEKKARDTAAAIRIRKQESYLKVLYEPHGLQYACLSQIMDYMH
jgi:hypothetical protein